MIVDVFLKIHPNEKVYFLRLLMDLSKEIKCKRITQKRMRYIQQLHFDLTLDNLKLDALQVVLRSQLNLEFITAINPYMKLQLLVCFIFIVDA